MNHSNDQDPKENALKLSPIHPTNNQNNIGKMGNYNPQNFMGGGFPMDQMGFNQNNKMNMGGIPMNMMNPGMVPPFNMMFPNMNMMWQPNQFGNNTHGNGNNPHHSRRNEDRDNKKPSGKKFRSDRRDDSKDIVDLIQKFRLEI